MAVEIEAKMKVPRFDEVLARLAECGAVFAGDELEINQFFDTPNSELRLAEKGLRLRVSRDLHNSAAAPVAFLTFKGPRRSGPFKSREELEIIVSDGDTTTALLKALGFAPTLSFEKRRRTWTLTDCKVELDELPHLGTFVEIEGPSETAISRVRQTLNLAQHPSINDSYIAMLAEYLLVNGIETRKITLEGKGKDEGGRRKAEG